MTETDGEVVHRVKHYTIYIVLGSLKQGPELELACHNYLYGSPAKPDCPHRRPGVVIRDLSIEHHLWTSFLSTSFRTRYTLFTGTVVISTQSWQYMNTALQGGGAII